jgi:hypothetical protein
MRFVNGLRLLTGSKKGAEAASEADDARREIALAEFSGLRQEIGARSGVQHQLMALNITALAAIEASSFPIRRAPFSSSCSRSSPRRSAFSGTITLGTSRTSARTSRTSSSPSWFRRAVATRRS